MDEEKPDFPEGISADLLTAKFAELENVTRKIGLYDPDLIFMGDTDEEDIHHIVIGFFQIGDQAWSDRVQDPATDETNDEFRKIRRAMINEDFEKLRERYRKRRDEGDEP